MSNAESFSAIANKNSSGEDYSQYANIYEILQGKFPGVQISNGEIIIRGMSSMHLYEKMIKTIHKHVHILYLKIY